MQLRKQRTPLQDLEGIGGSRLQLECKLADVPIAGGTEVPLAACPMLDPETPDRSKAPCWWARVDAAACPSAQSPKNVQLFLERNGQQAPFGTRVIARCATTH